MMLPAIYERLGIQPRNGKSYDPLGSFFEDPFGLLLHEPAQFEAWEDDDAVCVAVQMPGFEKDKIEITKEGRTLSISAAKTEEKGDRKYLSRGRLSTSFQQSISLPDGLGEDIEAKYESGILTVRLAKAPEKKPRKIQVK